VFCVYIDFYNNGVDEGIVLHVEVQILKLEFIGYGDHLAF
jgi:hypothetical protein